MTENTINADVTMGGAADALLVGRYRVDYIDGETLDDYLADRCVATASSPSHPGGLPEAEVIRLRFLSERRNDVNAINDR